MTSPAKRWRNRYERFDRTFGFLLGAVVGFVLFAYGAADSLEAWRSEAIVAGLAGALLLGTSCAVFGDKVLERVLRWLS